MEKKDFDAYIKKGEEVMTSDIGKSVDEWKHNVDALYSSVTGWLKDYIGTAIEVYYQEIRISEEQTGEYSINKMIIKTKEKQIELRPYGTYVIGLKGRVDMEGPHNKVMLGICRKDIDRPATKVRINDRGVISLEIGGGEENKEEKWVWKLITTPPQVRYIELTKEVFFDLFVGV